MKLASLIQARRCHACGGLAEDTLCESCGAALGREVFAGWFASEGPAGEGVADGLRFREKIGSGAHGEVWRAEDLTLGREVAVKLLHPVPSSEAAKARRLEWRFERERQVLAALRHPGIAVIHRSGVTDAGRPWFAMELVEGTCLDEWAEGSPSLRERLEVFQRLCDAIHHAHQLGIIHRDLKPANILVETGTHQPKVVDFGLAKVGESAPADRTLTLAGHALGTPVYMSPEQARGESALAGVRSDVYALGAVLLRLLAGAPPYDPERPTLEILEAIRTRPPRRLRELWPEAPRDLEAIISRATAREPRERYEGANDLRDDIGRFLAGHPVRARQGQRWYRLRKAALLHWRSLTAGAVVLGALAAAGIHAVAQTRQVVRRQEALLEQARVSLTSALLEVEHTARQAGHPEWAARMAERLATVPWEWAEDGTHFEAERFAILRSRFQAEWLVAERRFPASLPQWQEAALTAEAWLRHNENNQEARREAVLCRLGMGRTLREMSCGREALAELAQARGHLPGLAPEAAGELPSLIQLETGRCHHALERRTDAEAAFRQAVRPDGGPAVQMVKLELALVLAETGKADESLSLVESALAALAAPAAAAAVGSEAALGRAEGGMIAAAAMHALGRRDRALALLDDALARYRALGEAGVSFLDQHLFINAEVLRRQIALSIGETSPAAALPVLETALRHLQALRDPRMDADAREQFRSERLEIGRTMRALGECCLRLGDRAAAAEHFFRGTRRFAVLSGEFSDRPDLHVDALECAWEAEKLFREGVVWPGPLREWSPLRQKHLERAEKKLPAVKSAAQRAELAARLEKIRALPP